MGMFDTIIVDRLICPYCKKIIRNVDFQTKDGICVLASFHMGDVFSFSINPSRKMGGIWISGLASCPKCHYFDKKTQESVYTWLDAGFQIDTKTHRIVYFELESFKRTLLRSQRQHKGQQISSPIYSHSHKDFKLRKVRVFNPSKRR